MKIALNTMVKGVSEIPLLSAIALKQGFAQCLSGF